MKYYKKVLFFSSAMAIFSPALIQVAPAQPAASAGSESAATYIYKTVSGHQIHADVYRSGRSGLRPTILLIHGGALILGDRTGDITQVAEYVASGYNVVAIDYRLAPETKLPEIVSDVEDAHRWIRDNGADLFGGDPDRIAVVGHSAGAYLSLVAGFRLSPAPRAVVSFYGYGDISESWLTGASAYYREAFPPVSESSAFDAVGTTPISAATITEFSPADGRVAIYLYARQTGIWPQVVTGRHPATDRQWFSQFEPVRNVTSAYPPTLLLHGQSDTDVPFEKSMQMARELERAGVTYQLVTNAAWGHVFDRDVQDPAIVDAIAGVLRFLNQHLDR